MYRYTYIIDIHRKLTYIYDIYIYILYTENTYLIYIYTYIHESYKLNEFILKSKVDFLGHLRPKICCWTCFYFSYWLPIYGTWYILLTTAFNTFWRMNIRFLAPIVDDSELFFESVDMEKHIDMPSSWGLKQCQVEWNFWTINSMNYFLYCTLN